MDSKWSQAIALEIEDGFSSILSYEFHVVTTLVADDILVYVACLATVIALRPAENGNSNNIMNSLRIV